MRSARYALSATALFAVAALAAATSDASSVKSAATSCVRTSNIEAILDDSGSMDSTDPAKQRVKALNLLIDTPGNEQTTLGAVEFGGSFLGNEDRSDTIFPPGLIGQNATAMKTALDQKIQADNGGTDYNQAFARAKADNPNAKAWIFLTDGGHNTGTYNNGHQGGPPTYVIGFGSSTTGEDGQRLQQIANDTHGRYFPQTDSSNLPAVMNEIGTTLTCQSPPQTFTNQFSSTNQSAQRSVKIGSTARSAQFTLTWADPLDAFTVGNFVIKRHGKTVAKAKVKKLKLTRRSGTTFLVVKASGLVPGQLRFRVRPTRIGTGHANVRLTTQVSQARSK